MVEAARQQARVLADPEPGVLLTEFAESGINLELGFWVSDPEAGTGGVRSDIGLAILRSFRENGIEIPYPQREIRILRNLFILLLLPEPPPPPCSKNPAPVWHGI